MSKLSEEQIKQKLIEGRNYKRLYCELKVKYDDLKAENEQLKQELLDQRQYFSSIIETQAAQIAELQTMVFGKKKRPRSGGGHKPPGKTRNAASYRRPKPAEDKVTSEEHHPIDACNHCSGPLTDKEEYARFVEDIILAALSAAARFKTVEKHTIERGYCVPCGKYSSAQNLRGQEVSLGPNVRSLVCYLVTLRDHSYDQVINLLWDLYRFKITDGEITNILDARRLQLLPAYEDLKESIRAGPAVHMDESRWRIQSEHAGYAWSMSSTTSTDVVFKLADSRGKGNDEELLGKNFQGVGITDRYPGYKNLFWLHQICWAHLQRTAKDLTHLECLGRAKQKHVTKFYRQLAAIYASIRTYQEEPFDETKRKTQADTLLEQTKQLCRPHMLDPKKLTDLKAGILEYQDCLFVCLTTDGIPADNNRAERDIKQLVMKRRKSLGSKTPKGARTLEVLLSICWSLYNRDRDNFFPNFHSLAA
jgi:transposase